MRRLAATSASVLLLLSIVSCGKHGSDSDKQDPKKAFCAGIAFDYTKMMELAVSGDGDKEGVEGSRGFLKKLYTPAFVEGSPDEDLAQEVADGASDAVAGKLKQSDLDNYADQFNQLKTENEDEC